MALPGPTIIVGDDSRAGRADDCQAIAELGSRLEYVVTTNFLGVFGRDPIEVERRFTGRRKRQCGQQ